MSCGQAMQVQAYADGELDAASALAVGKHLEACAECRELIAGIEDIRKTMAQSAVYHRADDAFARHIRRQLSHEGWRSEADRPVFWRGAISGAVGMALAASLTLFLALPPAADEMANDAVAAHLRSLMGTHLIDVASSNHHVVKPWFAGHADISPPVTDYAKEGFPLVGGRVDYVNGERAAVVVYRHGAHVVNVFSWKDDGRAKPGARDVDGFHLVAWSKGGLFFCAVSDMDAAELHVLAGLILNNAPG